MLSMLRQAWGQLAPRRRGRWFVEGLSENVEVLSDQHGVPHVFAASQADLFFAQGYLHARERAFQLDVQRRIGQGRLAELFGMAALPADRFLRRLGLWPLTYRLWGQLEASQQRLLQNYARGVNAGLARLAPWESWLLGRSLEPYTALHSLLWIQVMAFDMGNNWEAEWLRARMLERLGPEKALSFQLSQPSDLPTALGSPCGSGLAGLEEEYRVARRFLDSWTSGGGGSNAWAVAPSRSASGHSLLAADPHVLAKVPSTWFQVHLEAPGLRLYGLSLPGTPGICLGHSDQVAWGITNSYVDTQDLVWEQRQGRQVKRPQGWVDLGLRSESIKVRGQKKPYLEEVWESDSGPILFQESEGRCLSLRWSGYHHSNATIKAWLGLMQAQSVLEAQQALKDWHSPVLNFVLADRAGNIGYQLAGRVPRRPAGSGVLPSPGWSEQGEWQGWLNYSELPSSYNPPSGIVVSANQTPQPFGQGPFLGLDFCDGYRAQRIHQLLQASPSISASDCRAMQMDTLSLAAVQAVPLLARDSGPHWRHPELLQELLAWDGDLKADSRPAALYQVLLLRLAGEAYREDLGPDLFAFWCGAPVSLLGVLGGQAGRFISFLLQDWQQGTRDWPSLCQRAWNHSLDELEQRLGKDPRTWRWGRLHTFQPRHPLAISPRLSQVLNPPALELGGDVTTILQSAVPPLSSYAAEGWVPSSRLVVDFADPVQSGSVLPTGHSGWLGDRHCFDQQSLWQQGKLHESFFDRARLESSRPQRLVLLALNR